MEMSGLAAPLCGLSFPLPRGPGAGEPAV